ncbi:DUF2848 domain-containing protein [Fodinicurvata sediminis]|uniref:DUF2848 domain-containing protein n=1 Tax=Fodinicurvata sediminis TaxID=1121832 RepID=UPI0003B30921|nr:DUF2848 domain-containing protein [Fodinicurvata sediminis]
MHFTCNGTPLKIDIAHCTVAGWTGRDRTAIDHHIEELAAIGVTPPSAVPLYYRVSPDLLTQKADIQVVGDNTSGEVEPLLVRNNGKTYIGLASDHTDRTLEAHSVAHSKQVCAKPCAGELWEFAPIAERLDELQLRSWIVENGKKTLYQEGTLASIRPLEELIKGAGLLAAAGEQAAAMLCGTFGVQGGVRPAAEFHMELHDPAADRSIRHSYRITPLPVVA